MALVYFLLIPSALIATELWKTSEVAPDVALAPIGLSNYGVLLQATAIMLVTGLLFGTVARWLASFHYQESHNESSIHSDRSPIGWLLQRGSQLQLLVWIWCAIQPIVMIASGWIFVASSSRLLSSLLHFHSVKILYLAIPTVVVMTAINLGQEFSVVQERDENHSLPQRFGVWWNRRFRFAAHTWLIPIAMCLVVCTVVDASQLTKVVFPGTNDYQSLVVLMTFLIGTMLFAPHGMALLIHSESVPRDTEKMIRDVWRVGSKQVPTVLCWKTGNRVSNAMVVGMLGIGRKLLLTDLLLYKLDRHELQMVVLHELAHCVRYHAWVRIIPTAITVGLMLFCMNTWQGTTLSMICIGLLAAFLLSLVAVCWWTEFDADRTALRLAERIESFDGDGEFDSIEKLGKTCTSLADIAPEKLSSALKKVYGWKNHSRTSWLHPSCNQRIWVIQNTKLN